MKHYTNIKIQNDSIVKEGVRFRSTTKYPTIPLSVNDIYVITQSGDRYDLLANRYYNDKSLWWVIACANPSIIFGTLIPPPGFQLRIPIKISSILDSYNKLNNG